MKFLSGVFIFIGIFTIANGLLMNPETSIHQIYSMLNVLTGFVILFCGLVMPKLCLIADRLKTKEEIEAEETKKYNETHYYKKEDNQNEKDNI